MNHRKFTADRWTVSAYSPLDLETLASLDEIGLIHPGWASHPRAVFPLAMSLAERGIAPLIVDTRFGYANQSPLKPHRAGSLPFRLALQSYSTGDGNIFFPWATSKENRGKLRKATSTLAIADALGVKKFHLVGHSDGGRTVTTIAGSHPERVKSLTVVNSIGTDPVLTPGITPLELAQQFKDRSDARKARNTPKHLRADKEVTERFYHPAHLRRSIGEAITIGQADGWPIFGNLTEEGIPVNIVHGQDDPAIDVDRVAYNAQKYPGVNFVKVPGGHNSLYDQIVADIIADTIVHSAVDR